MEIKLGKLRVDFPEIDESEILFGVDIGSKFLRFRNGNERDLAMLQLQRLGGTVGDDVIYKSDSFTCHLLSENFKKVIFKFRDDLPLSSFSWGSYSVSGKSEFASCYILSLDDGRRLAILDLMFRPRLGEPNVVFNYMVGGLSLVTSGSYIMRKLMSEVGCEKLAYGRELLRFDMFADGDTIESDSELCSKFRGVIYG